MSVVVVVIGAAINLWLYVTNRRLRRSVEQLESAER